MAASIAFPPRFKTSTPTREATSFVEATMPCLARTGSREAAIAVFGVKQGIDARGATKRTNVMASERTSGFDFVYIIDFLSVSLCNVSVLCVSVVGIVLPFFTTKARRALRLHRELPFKPDSQFQDPGATPL
jgi:hypothetical protein